MRGKVVKFDHADYVLSDAPGDWPAVISLEDWQHMSATWGQRKQPTRAPESEAILTGLLWNFCGRPMMHTRTGYSCRCGDPYVAKEVQPIHASLQVAHSKIHTYVVEVLAALIDRLPEGELPTPTKPRVDARTLYRQVNALRLEIRELKADHAQMVGSETRLISMMGEHGEEHYKEALRAKTESLDSRNKALAELEAEQAEAEDAAIGAATLPLIARFRDIGFRESWAKAANSDRRLIAGSFIRRIDFLGPDPIRTRGDAPLLRHRHMGCVVTLRPWCAPYLPQSEMPAMKGRYAPPRNPAQN